MATEKEISDFYERHHRASSTASSTFCFGEVAADLHQEVFEVVILNFSKLDRDEGRVSFGSTKLPRAFVCIIYGQPEPSARSIPVRQPEPSQYGREPDTRTFLKPGLATAG